MRKTYTDDSWASLSRISCRRAPRRTAAGTWPRSASPGELDGRPAGLVDGASRRAPAPRRRFRVRGHRRPGTGTGDFAGSRDRQIVHDDRGPFFVFDHRCGARPCTSGSPPSLDRGCRRRTLGLHERSDPRRDGDSDEPRRIHRVAGGDYEPAPASSTKTTSPSSTTNRTTRCCRTTSAGSPWTRRRRDRLTAPPARAVRRVGQSRWMSASSCTESAEPTSTSLPSSARAARPALASISSAILASMVCAAMIRHAVTGSPGRCGACGRSPASARRRSTTARRARRWRRPAG